MISGVVLNPYNVGNEYLGGLPLITYAYKGRGGVKSPLHFHYVLVLLDAKIGRGGPDSM